MTKISISDLTRIRIKETSNICKVSKGDLIKVKSKRTGDFLAIVVELYDDKMCLLTNKHQKQWWTRYVNCNILAYNNNCTS